MEQMGQYMVYNNTNVYLIIQGSLNSHIYRCLIKNVGTQRCQLLHVILENTLY